MRTKSAPGRVVPLFGWQVMDRAQEIARQPQPLRRRRRCTDRMMRAPAPFPIATVLFARHLNKRLSPTRRRAARDLTGASPQTVSTAASWQSHTPEPRPTERQKISALPGHRQHRRADAKHETVEIHRRRHSWPHEAEIWRVCDRAQDSDDRESDGWANKAST